MEERKNIVFLTRHYPPNKNINGLLVCDMVRDLQAKDKICTIITIENDAPGNNEIAKPEGNVIRLRTLIKYSNSKFSRLINMLYDGYRLVKKSIKYSKNSTIICTTSPPLLPFWAALLFSKNTYWGLWAFDLFPEGFVASNQISSKNLLYKLIERVTYSRSPKFLIALGPNQAEFIKKKYKHDIKTYIIPAGRIENVPQKSLPAPIWKDLDKVTFGYLGNLGNAHNPEFLKAIIDNIDPFRHQLILKIYGEHAKEIANYAEGKSGVKIITDYISHAEMQYIDIHLVSLKSSWTHIAVPSKATTAVTLGCKILFCGSKESDVWQMFRDNGWLIDESEDIDKQLKRVLNEV